MLTKSQKFSVDFFDCDTFAYLRISRLCEFFQETSLKLLRDQGFDYLSMIEKDNFTLLISRIKLRISHLPVWGEDIFISAWIKNINPEKVAWSDYDVRDAQGNSIIQATSSWLLVGLEDKKAKPFSESPYRFEMHPELSVLPESIELLEPIGMPKTVLVKDVRYSDIDLNNHVNNCKYSDWVLDTLSMEELKERKIRSIQLNYMQQVEYNTKVALMRFPGSRHHIVIFGVNEEHPEQVHFQARLGFDKPLVV
ncbi:MAG: thioesterase [Fibromonadales bacterium]|nr:thioesterase [Fibromonadales bacterium]